MRLGCVCLLSHLSLLCLIYGYLGEAAAAGVVRWIDATAAISPLYRPDEAFKYAKNGTICSPDRRLSLELKTGGKTGSAVWWKVTEGTDPSGWAACRIAFPEPAAGKLAGLRFSLVSPVEREVKLVLYRGLNGPNFYEAQAVGSVRRSLSPGINEFDFRFSETGAAEAESSQGIGIVIENDRDAVEIGIRRIDLLFRDETSAGEFERAPVRTSVEILRSRGIDLTGLEGRLTAAQLDARCWTAFHLLAIGEQIGYWKRLARARGLVDRESARLETRRQTLVSSLTGGEDAAPEVDRLQRAVDAFVDSVRGRIQASRRRFYLGEDKRFHYPDGRPFRMLGPYLFRLDSPRREHPAVTEWDIRYLAALGFTGIRLAIQWHILEPERGRFQQWYLEQLKDVVRLCERYGLGVSVDLHFRRPSWFLKAEGEYALPEGAVPTGGEAYHWPEALVSTWTNLAKELAQLPNVVAWEVPLNEPMLVSGPRGISPYPWLVRSWNQWLRQKYGSRERLREAWDCAEGREVYGLQPDESWDDNSIRWMIVEEKPDVQANYRNNPRLWDHLRWTAHLQSTVTARIMKGIRLSVPGAVGMMHRTIGDHWDGSPVPLNYTAIETLRGEHVMPGTHYGIAGLSALRAASQTYASYDTEQHVRNEEKAVRRHVELGLGLCPFWFSSYGYPHEIMLADDYGHIHPGAAYLPKLSAWLREHWPPDRRDEGKAAVAVVLSTRMHAINQERLGNLLELLEEYGCPVGVFNGLEVVQRPELLADYDAVITHSGYMDVELLGVLQERYRGAVLLHGSLERDALARGPENGLCAEMVRRGVLLRNTAVRRLPERGDERMDLSGEWAFRHLGDAAVPGPPPSGPVDPDWRPIPVPGMWAGAGFLPFTAARNVVGYGWYRKDVEIPAEWKDRSLRLVFGAIDDYDWVYVNGRLVGCTDERATESWVKRRVYPVPRELVNFGGKNEVAVLVRNVAGDGGISTGPVELVAGTQWLLRGAGVDGLELFAGPGETFIPPESLAGDARVVFSAGSGEVTAPALVRQGRWLWWISDSEWGSSEAERQVLRALLSQAGPGRGR